LEQGAAAGAVGEGQGLGRVRMNAGIGRMSALGGEPDTPGWRE